MQTIAQQHRVSKEKILKFVGLKLASDNKWAAHALDVVYANQTYDEQKVKATVEDNKVGFTGLDAEFLSSLAESKKRFGQLTDRQMAALKRTIAKYRGQVVQASVAAGKIDRLQEMAWRFYNEKA